MSDQSCVVCGAFVGHGDACPVQLDELREENERLKAEKEDMLPAAEFISLHARLSAAEEERVLDKDCIRRTQRQLQRAEAVVEAASASTGPGYIERLRNAVRRYKEGK